MIEDIIPFLVGIGVGMLIAFHLAHLMVRMTISTMREQLEAEDEPTSINGKEVVDAVITKEQDTYYLFQKDNDRFLAQGKTLEEIHEALSSRFKNLVVKVDKIPEELKQKTT